MKDTLSLLYYIVHFNLQREDNLSIKEEMAGPNMSIINFRDSKVLCFMHIPCCKLEHFSSTYSCRRRVLHLNTMHITVQKLTSS